MTEELKPCPFCGSTYVDLCVSKFSSVVACGECQSEGPNIHDEGEAVRKWNRRAAPSQPEGAEPSAWRIVYVNEALSDELTSVKERAALAEHLGYQVEPLYLHPSQSAGADSDALTIAYQSGYHNGKRSAGAAAPDEGSKA